jgi:hypothetical protein
VPLWQPCEIVGAPAAALIVHPAAPMVATPPPIDENKLQLVREFLQREFRASRHEDYFDSVEMAQVFVIEPIQGPRHTLVIPKRTFEDPDFTLLCDARLVEALQSALDTRLVLTPEGVK